jgi:erythromycin esterase-like protein
MTRYVFLLVICIISSTSYCNAQYSYISRGYESDTLSKEQIALITRDTKEPKIIGLGEADHLKATFYRIKSQLVRRLILKNDVDLVVFEADLNTCAQLDKYVKGDSSIQLRQLLLQMNATNNYILHNLLNTPEIEGLINWIKNYNTTHDKKVSLAGIDFQMPVNLGNVIAPYLSPELHTELTAAIDVYNKFYHVSWTIKTSSGFSL